MKCFVLLTLLVFASKNESDANESVAGNLITENMENPVVVKIEQDECVKKRSSTFIGVTYSETKSRWNAYRWSKMDKKVLTNGKYNDEETAAHASDTLARTLMVNGEQNHILNFPDDETEVHPEKKIKRSTYFGICYNEKFKRWSATRWSKLKKKSVNNGTYRDEEKAAHASDTLARKLMANGEQGHKLNFPGEDTEVYCEAKTSNSIYFGVNYNEQARRWIAQRWSKTEKKLFYYGAHRDEEKAAHASDILARKLIANGEQHHKLNFPHDTEEHSEQQNSKRKRRFGFEYSQTNGNNLEKFEEKEK